MAIYFNYVVTVSGNEALLNKSICLYQGNRNIDYYFTIKDAQFKFSRTENDNIIEKLSPSHAAVTLLRTSDNVEVGTGRAEVLKDKIKLTITREMIDENIEVGKYTIVIDLLDDERDSIATLPPIVDQFEILPRITSLSFDNVVNEALVGYAMTTSTSEPLAVFDDAGNYIKTVWVVGDKITAEKLEKIEEAIYQNTTQLHDVKSGKVDKVTGKSLIADTEIARLSTVTNYTHPSTHLPSIISQDTNNRFVTDAEKSTWNSKSNFDGNYNNLTNKPTIPSAYTLPIATASTLGGIKVGAGLSITAGVLSTTGGGVADSVEWSNIQNKPSVFTPSSHTHTKADITDFTHVHSYADLTNKPIIPSITNDLTNTLKTNYDNAYTHSQGTHAPTDAQKNSDITKEEIEAKLTGVISSHNHASNLVATSIEGTALTLTTDKYQSTTMVDGTEIALPVVASFTEIHLFFSASTDMTLTLPSCKWQTTPSIKSGKYYELIFTYTTEWLGGVVQYG